MLDNKNMTQDVKERISKKIRESAVSNNGVYFVDAESYEFDLILFPLIKINEGEEFCTVRVPKKYQGHFRSTEITLTLNERTKHLEYSNLRHWMVNYSDLQFGRDYENALSLRNQIITRRVEGSYREVERLITLKSRYKK
jgi:hypothetical protein